MAATALSRGSGVAGVRTTKGLFFIFTLLCLVSLASSLSDKEKLENLKKVAQKFQQNLDFAKAKRATYSEFLSEYLNFLDLEIALVRKVSNVLPELSPLGERIEETKAIVEKCNEKNENLYAASKSAEKKLGEMKKVIQFLEEQEAEL